MNDVVVLKAFDFYRKNGFYDKIGILINDYSKNFAGTDEELIDVLITNFSSRLSRYNQNEYLILQSLIEEQLLKLRQRDETIPYSKVEIDFHIEYFNLIALAVKKVEEHEKLFFKTLKDRVERASDLLKNAKIQTNLQLLKADLNQKSQLLLETDGTSGEAVKDDKIRNISKMNKALKLKTVKSYQLYNVTEFCNFMSKLDAKGFFTKLEKDYSTEEVLEIYYNYQFVTSEKHGINHIHHYNHPKSKMLAYFLEARSEEEYNEKIMNIVEKDNLDDVQRKMYKRVLTQKQTLDQKLPLADFQRNQSLTEEEKRSVWGINYLDNINNGVKMRLSDLIYPGSRFLREIFKSTELSNWMLGEINEVEAVYKTKEYGLSYYFTLQKDGFSSFGRINYSIIQQADYFFSKEDEEKFYHWIFDCIEIISPKKMRNPETKQDSNFLIQFVTFRLKNNNLSKGEFEYLFNLDSLNVVSRGDQSSEFVFKLLKFAMERFSVAIDMDIFLDIMRLFDKSGASLPIIETLYPKEYEFILSLVNDLVAEHHYENIHAAYLKFLQ